MGKVMASANQNSAGIKCIEIQIPKGAIAENANNVLWTLSVYSLENQSMPDSRSLSTAELFHFMVYDWKRTIKHLLITHRIPYTITEYFTPDSIYSDGDKVDSRLSQTQRFTSLETMAAPGAIPIQDARRRPEGRQRESADLILDVPAN